MFPLESLLILALVTGMCIGEMLALRWQDIDFEKKSLQVRRSVDCRQRKQGHNSREELAAWQHVGYCHSLCVLIQYGRT